MKRQAAIRASYSQEFLSGLRRLLCLGKGRKWNDRIRKKQAYD